MPTTTRAKTFNPYQPFTDPSEACIITSQVSPSDYRHIRQLRLGIGTINGTIGHLWKQLCYELRERNIIHTTDEARFEQFLANFRIVPIDEYNQLLLDAGREGGVHDRPAGESVPLSGRQDESGTASGLRDEAKKLSPNASDVQGGCGKPLKGNKNKAGSGGKKS